MLRLFLKRFGVYAVLGVSLVALVAFSTKSRRKTYSAGEVFTAEDKNADSDHFIDAFNELALIHPGDSTKTVTGAFDSLTAHNIAKLVLKDPLVTLDTSDSLVIHISNLDRVNVDSLYFGGIPVVAFSGGATSGYRIYMAYARGDTLIVDSFLGVGLTDPDEPLDVLTDSGGEAIAIEENSGDEQWELGVDAAGDLNFQNSGSISASFTDVGSHGLGVSAPKNVLDVEGNVAIGATYSGTNNAPANGLIVEGQAGFGMNDPSEPVDILTDAGGEALSIEENSGDEQWEFGVDAAGDLNIQNDGSISASFTDVGSHGLGVSAPKNILDVEGNVAIGATYSGTNNAPSNGLLVEGQVGFGLTDPGDPLQILTDAGGEALTLEENSGDETWELGIDAEGDLNFQNSGSISASFTDVGSHGLGVSAPKNILDVEGNVAIGSTYSGTNNAPTDGLIVEGQVGLGMDDPSEPLDVLTDAGGEAISIEENSGDEQWEFGVDAEGDLNFQNDGSIWATFTDPGSAGFGLSDPTNTVQILTDAVGEALGIEENSGDESWEIGVDAAGDLNFFNSSSLTTSFTDVGSHGLGVSAPKNILDVEGNVAIGATYSGTNNAPSNGLLVEGQTGIGLTDPDEPLDVLTDAGGEAIAIEENSGDEQWELGVDADGNLDFQNSGSLGIVFTDANSILVLDDAAIGLGAQKALIEFDDQSTDEINFLYANVTVTNGTLTASNGGSLTGTWTDLGTVTTVDVDGGTLDAVTIGNGTPGSGDFTTLTASAAASFSGGMTANSVDIAGGEIDGTAIGANSASTGAFSTLSATGNVSLDGGTLIYNETSADLDARFEGNGNANLLFLDAGNDDVGIGTNAPSNVGFTSPVLAIESAGHTGIELVSTAADGDGSYIGALNSWYATNSASHKRVAEIDFLTDGSTANQRGGQIRFATKPDGSTSITDRMTIDEAGNVGVGTASPDEMLELSSATGSATIDPTTIRIRSTTSAADFDDAVTWGNVDFWSDDVTGSGAATRVRLGAYSGIGGGSSGFKLWVSNQAALDVEALSITPAGNVGIGTASPGAALEVLDDLVGFCALFKNDGDNANREGIYVKAGAYNASGNTIYLNALDGDGGQVGYIWNTSGTFQLVDGSDRRMKQNIRDTEISGLDIINNIRVRDFEEVPSVKQTGFVAQELALVYPKAAAGDSTATRMEVRPDTVRVNVHPVRGDTSYVIRQDTTFVPQMMGVAKSELIAPLVKAVQELVVQNEAQQTEIDDLKARVAALEAVR